MKTLKATATYSEVLFESEVEAIDFAEEQEELGKFVKYGIWDYEYFGVIVED